MSEVSAAGRRWPAEWESHRATWLSWPHNKVTWPTRFSETEDAFCEMVRALVPGEDVEINVPDSAAAGRVREKLASAGVGGLDRVRFHLIPTNDAWVRDHGGIIVFEDGVPANAAPERVLLDFEFDAWGGKYPPWDLDRAVAGEMARVLDLRREQKNLVLEGGSIDGDGEGTILTTESCLLNPNRARPGVDRSRSALEEALGEAFGARKVLWLEEGIEGDDTDGHIDDLTRFVGPGRVVTSVERDPKDPNYSILEANRARLETLVDSAGRCLEVVELPMPPARLGPHGRVPASYANFYFANAGVLLPVFGVDMDREAIAILESVVRDRPILPIPAQDLVLGLGAVHCLTQQEPASPPPAS